MPTDNTGANASDVAEAAVIQPLLQVKPPKPFDFMKHEEWPCWLKDLILDIFNAKTNANNDNVKNHSAGKCAVNHIHLRLSPRIQRSQTPHMNPPVPIYIINIPINHP